MGGNKAGAKKRWRAKVRKRVLVTRLKKAEATEPAAAKS
jgi:hypothetical protein